MSVNSPDFVSISFDASGSTTEEGLEIHPLLEVYMAAIEQAQGGKGMERHGTTPNFLDQPIFHIAKLTGPSGPLYQVLKKSHEAIFCEANGTFTKAEAYNELLGALVYLGAVTMLFKED